MTPCRVPAGCAGRRRAARPRPGAGPSRSPSPSRRCRSAARSTPTTRRTRTSSASTPTTSSTSSRKVRHTGLGFEPGATRGQGRAFLLHLLLVRGAHFQHGSGGREASTSVQPLHSRACQRQSKELSLVLQSCKLSGTLILSLALEEN